MRHLEPKDLTVPEVHRLLLGGVGPRPIALVSTMSESGIPNLTPFSFFNAFGANPPVIAFSPARRGKDGTLKDTFNNLMATKECVVQSVNYSMVEQISLASTEYPPEIDEFIKTGLTPIDSDLVKPKRVKESPFQMECKLLEIKSFGDKGSSANIAICEVIKFHIAEDIFKDGIIHPDLIDLVARMSANFYTRASGSSIFEVEKPILKKGIGFDQLPNFIKKSHVFSANNLGKLANVERIPTSEEVEQFINEINLIDKKNIELSDEAFHRYDHRGDYQKMLITLLNSKFINYPELNFYYELTAKKALEKNDTLFAWKTLLIPRLKDN
jgi:flavin reductase (DIM6/NTAB) family NADH-FMN oxidoreductase RutF